uniref:MULE transposase domain-containing protein n=1 Tax=Amphimedon queenslandica TaxID=400682 RepID=A0A1X7UE11_AMPQE
MVMDQMNVECHIQDGDSRSENVVIKHFPLFRVLQCGNHVAKNHAIKLDKLRKLKQIDN